MLFWSVIWEEAVGKLLILRRSGIGWNKKTFYVVRGVCHVVGTLKIIIMKGTALIIGCHTLFLEQHHHQFHHQNLIQILMGTLGATAAVVVMGIASNPHHLPCGVVCAPVVAVAVAVAAAMVALKVMTAFFRSGLGLR